MSAPRAHPIAAFSVLFLAAWPASAQSVSPPGYSQAIFGEIAAGYVPYANDVPLMLGLGVRAFPCHEVWARIGYMPTGDDVDHGFAVVGYRAVLRPGRVVRPVIGAYFAGLSATCGHDEAGRPSCSPDVLYIFSATGGVRFEPRPWLGLSALLSFGIDSYPNPFGMLEVATTFFLPL